MAVRVCHFEFDGHTYMVRASIALDGRVTAIASQAAQKGPRAQDVNDLADVYGSLLAVAADFDAFGDMPQSPLGCAILSAIQRESLRARAVRP